MMHTLIVGERGVGKSTLIHRVLAQLGRPVFGFETKKESALADADGLSPVYIYEAGQPRQRSEANLAGFCSGHGAQIVTAAFDRYAPKLRTCVPEGHIVLMDELGFMESASETFRSAVLSLLDGDAPVIAAVKYKSTPFLEALRSHPKARCFYITEENRDTLYEEVLAFMKDQLEPQRCGRL